MHHNYQNRLILSANVLPDFSSSSFTICFHIGLEYGM
jgi:hypothetical protein